MAIRSHEEGLLMKKLGVALAIAIASAGAARAADLPTKKEVARRRRQLLRKRLDLA